VRRDHLTGLFRDCLHHWTHLLRQVGRSEEALIILRGYLDTAQDNEAYDRRTILTSGELMSHERMRRISVSSLLVPARLSAG
jgi:hypothetical protein